MYLDCISIIIYNDRIQKPEDRSQNEKMFASNMLLFLNLIQDLFVFLLTSGYRLLNPQTEHAQSLNTSYIILENIV